MLPRFKTKTPRCEPRGFSIHGQPKDQSMSLSSARNYALRASKSQDQKEAIELLSKAGLRLLSKAVRLASWSIFERSGHRSREENALFDRANAVELASASAE